MSRHSKNNTANPVFTYAERQMKQRIGVDSQKPFEHCTLCLSKVIEPMICDKGHLFCKECIIENMMKQKKQNISQMDVFKKRQEFDTLKVQEKEDKIKLEQFQQFEKLDYYNDINQRKAVKNTTDQKLQGYLTFDEKESVIIRDKLQEKGKIMITQPKQELTQNIFWIPEGNHFEKEGALDKTPANKIICPATNDHEIKIKKLVRVHLSNGGMENSEEVVCYACSKKINYQKVAAIKQCGHVMCKLCIEKICLPDKKCMVCSKAFDKNDIIPLDEAKSAFASHNQVQAQKYVPQMLI